MQTDFDVSEMMARRLPPAVMTLIKDISAVAGRLRLPLYVVGGTVRDLFLGRANLDLDFVVEAGAEDLAAALKAEHRARTARHSQFHTVKVQMGEFTFDIAMARSETYARPGALPAVKPDGIAEDLSRRDFTINAMAVSLDRADFGALVDPFGGRGDIEAGLIRVLHDRSFADDPTRMFRALRYKHRLGFELEPDTARLLAKDVTGTGTVSGDRQRRELELILKEERPELALLEADRVGLLKQVFADLKFDDWLAARFQSAGAGLPVGSLPLLYWSLLCYRLDLRGCQELIGKLRLQRRVADVITEVQQLKPLAGRLSQPGLRRSELYRLLSAFHAESIETARLLSDSTGFLKNTQLFLNELRYVKACTSGDRLLELGVAAGPRVGLFLDRLLDARLDGVAVSGQDEERLVLQWQQELKES